jgi:hypothetical protein
MGYLDVAAIFRDEAKALADARERCVRIHGTDDIGAAGNEVEMPIRDLFARMLPKRFTVTHGHLMDRAGTVSPQLDIIISDNTAVSSLFTTADGTSFVPVEATYAVGEIKSSYYKAKKYVSRFSETLQFIREKMGRVLVPNTLYGGITGNTEMAHVFLGRPHRYLNPLFSFMLFVNHGDATTEHLDSVFTACPRVDMPGISVILDHGVILFARTEGMSLVSDKYPQFNDASEFGWKMVKHQRIEQVGSLEGNHLAALYHALLSHLNESHLEPPNLLPYLSGLLQVRMSSIVDFGIQSTPK